MLRGSEGKQAVADLKILGPLGVGGFGTVYEALDERTGQHVAVKQLGDTSADSIARFKHEFRALADCHHENLVCLRELIEQDGRWLIVMDLVPGSDFLHYVRGPENDNDGRALPFDETRLRSALIGVVQGLRALHGFGVVHRDLKPSNVRVTPEGRAVLLDFGLATSVDPSKQSTHAMGLGTVIYMAPEQAGSERIGPAADMYALGVCLFEALTGRAPFESGNAFKILLDKQRVLPVRARSLVPSVPAELDELCARLLAIEPASRPSCDEALSILTRAPLARPSLPEQPAAGEPNFAGREAELAHLERALSRTNEGEQRLVLVEGESGVGKSELVSEFLRCMAGTRQRFLALRGRCYESEQVSYKAFDGCVDELARVLRRLPTNECAALMPEQAGLLGQLFPVLRTVPAIANGSREGMFAIVEAIDFERISDGGVFMRGWNGVVEAAMRNGLEFEAFYVDFDFFESSDRFGGLWFSYPHQDPYHSFGGGVSVGTADDQDYLEYGLNGRWRFPNRLTLSGSAQFVEFGGEEFIQHVVGLSYEIDKYRSIVGRAVFRNDSNNWYLSYRQSGNKGIEYFVILGDPNADEFSERLIVKVVAPFNIKI